MLRRPSRHKKPEVVHACMLNHSVLSNSLWPSGQQPTRLLCPWDSPGLNTGMGCNALLQGIFLTQESNPHLLSPALTGGFFITSTTWEARSCTLMEDKCLILVPEQEKGLPMSCLLIFHFTTFAENLSGKLKTVWLTAELSLREHTQKSLSGRFF